MKKYNIKQVDTSQKLELETLRQQIQEYRKKYKEDKEMEVSSDYELFKKLFSYFENDKVFYSFNRKGNRKENKYDENEEKEEDDIEGNKMRGGDKDLGAEMREEELEDDSQENEGSEEDAL